MTSNIKLQRPLLEILVDARQFDEGTFQQAAKELRPYFAVNGGPTIKLSELPPLVIVITFVLSTFGAITVNIISSALYDWLKKWAIHSAHNEEVTVVFKILDGKDIVKDARITMPGSDEDVKEALAAISEFLEGSQQHHRIAKSSKSRKASD